MANLSSAPARFLPPIDHEHFFQVRQKFPSDFLHLGPFVVGHVLADVALLLLSQRMREGDQLLEDFFDENEEKRLPQGSACALAGWFWRPRQNIA